MQELRKKYIPVMLTTKKCLVYLLQQLIQKWNDYNISTGNQKKMISVTVLS